MEAEKKEFKSALLDFNSDKARNILSSQVKNKIEFIPSLIEDVLIDIGKEWEKGELALSQVYMSGMICEKLVEDLFIYKEDSKIDKSKIGIVTFNDFHSLGKKIVLSVLRSVGFNVVDLGFGIDSKTLINKIKKEKINILLISVLMLPSALKIKELREELRKRNHELKILVGGAPFIFDHLLWEQVGADAMGRTPSDAIIILRNWLK